jgi:hypothetical protein
VVIVVDIDQDQLIEFASQLRLAQADNADSEFIIACADVIALAERDVFGKWWGDHELADSLSRKRKSFNNWMDGLDE